MVNHKRVERLMKCHDMAGFVPRKRRVTTTADSAHRLPDLLEGDFGAARPDTAWVGDISYIRTRQGFLYLAFVLDLASRRVVGISMAPHLKASLATDALREAIATRGGQIRDVIFHTDRGSQGGFNWWSQHLRVKEVCDESKEGSSVGSCVEACDAVAWSSAGLAA